jgi:hypothetical protein
MMSITAEIVRTYRSPRAAIRSRLARGAREDRALLILMLACGLIFVAQWPRLSREAHLTERPLEVLLGGALMAWIFVAPLLLYGVAALSILALRVAGRSPLPLAARLALFWALLCAAPLWLLHGLVAGLTGPGWELTLVGAVAVAVFLWFWSAGLKAACGSPP